MTQMDQNLLRIGVFYDGGFFHHISNYFRYNHSRKQRISLQGLHNLIRNLVSDAEGTDVRFSRIVEAHYFRGRLDSRSLTDIQIRNERSFFDVLVAEGILAHFLPMSRGEEKGVDVWLALEAFELATYKRFSVLVLFAGDSDFIPLVRKVSSLGIRVMVLGCNFQCVDDSGREFQTTTSAKLMEEASYSSLIDQLVDDKSRRNVLLIDQMFIHDREGNGFSRETSLTLRSEIQSVPAHSYLDSYLGTIQNLKPEGYGFITSNELPDNIFFHSSQLLNVEFDELAIGDEVGFSVEEGPRGPQATKITLAK
ncbi:MAG: NYN domain-containing protein [Deltaproteobacteria bacterium]|nr:NYN domain-containing protein [Deltaproteobacteria bacterium]